MAEKTRKRPRSAPTAWIVAAVAAAVAALLLVVPQLTGGDDPDGAAATDPSAAANEDPALAALAALARRDPGDPTALGEPDAPVVMLAYSDFQCPFCGRYALETEPELVERYVTDGTLRIEWRDFPYLGQESVTAARAGRAAAQQDRFWEFHAAMFADQPAPNSGDIDTGYLVDKAEQIGLDVAQFQADLTSAEVAEAVDRDFTEGQMIGVLGTPSFIINGRPLVGAQPLDVFITAIEQAAAEAS